MGMGGGEERGVENEGDRDPKIAAHDAVEEKSENEFLGNWRHHYRQHNDHDSLPDCLRAVEKIDNFLPARTAAEKSLSQCFGEQNQWCGREQQNDCDTERAFKTRFRKTT